MNYTREEYDSFMAILKDLLEKFEAQQDESTGQVPFGDFVDWLRRL